MNKKVMVILFVAFLLLQGVACLCGDETYASTENDINDLTEPLPPDTPPTLSGIGNGGGNPG